MGRFFPSEFSDRAILLLTRAFELFTRLLGPVLIALAMCLISLVVYTFFDGIAPALGLEAFSLSWCIVSSIGIWILINLLFNYGASILISAGNPQVRSTSEASAPPTQSAVSLVGTSSSVNAARQRGTGLTGGAGDLEQGNEMDIRYTTEEDEDEELLMHPNRVKYCRKCKAKKPPRAHHCHVCGRCVLKMDHHCPWLGSCVGNNNYMYFVKMLFFFWIGCTYIALLSALPFADSLSIKPGVIPARQNAFDVNARISLCFVMCVAIGIAVSLLFAWHLYLVSTNQTSIEYLQNSSTKSRLQHKGVVFRNPFDLGMKRNWIVVFGPAPWYKHLFPRFCTPACDGWMFDTNR